MVGIILFVMTLLIIAVVFEMKIWLQLLFHLHYNAPLY